MRRQRCWRVEASIETKSTLCGSFSCAARWTARDSGRGLGSGSHSDPSFLASFMNSATLLQTPEPGKPSILQLTAIHSFATPVGSSNMLLLTATHSFVTPDGQPTMLLLLTTHCHTHLCPKLAKPTRLCLRRHTHSSHKSAVPACFCLTTTHSFPTGVA